MWVVVMEGIFASLNITTKEVTSGPLFWVGPVERATGRQHFQIRHVLSFEPVMIVSPS